MVAPIVTVPAAARPVSSVIPVVSDVARLRVLMVNVYFVGDPNSSDWSWVLVDAGLPRSAAAIRRAAEERFGRDARPRAIVLTHAHFDHVGALPELMRVWPDVPVYAHELEVPYLKGRSKYPPPDPTVGGGAMTRLSPLYPRGPIDLGENVFALPSDGSIPGMPGWNWVPTPGHSPGHVSLFREGDRTLIAGDAIVTTKQESFWSVLTQRQELRGPPMYYTQDWAAAKASVRALNDLRPMVAATGHGVPMRGSRLREALQRLTDNFDRLAVPRDGRYVREPAVADRRGTVSVPPPMPDVLPKLLLGAAASFAAVALINALRKPFPDEIAERDERFVEGGV